MQLSKNQTLHNLVRVIERGDRWWGQQQAQFQPKPIPSQVLEFRVSKAEA